jgi:hypothetical protein
MLIESLLGMKNPYYRQRILAEVERQLDLEELRGGEGVCQMQIFRAIYKNIQRFKSQNQIVSENGRYNLEGGLLRTIEERLERVLEGREHHHLRTREVFLRKIQRKKLGGEKLSRIFLEMVQELEHVKENNL